MEKQLDVPALSYFEQGNVFTGSCRKDFRYRIAKQEDSLSAWIWYADVCFEKAGDSEELTFPLTSEGLSECAEKIAGYAQNP